MAQGETMTARQKFAQGAQRSSDSSSLALVALVSWAAAEFGGVELPPGISETLAGYVVMIGTRIRGAL
jgi:hypothetical protein